MGYFLPFATTARVVFKLAGARVAVGKETQYLSTPHGSDPPSMVVSELPDSSFKSIYRIQPTLVVNRKSVGIYKGRLSARGDPIPMTNTSSASSLTAHRGAVKLVASMVATFGFNIHDVDVSLSFLHSDPLRPQDRGLILHPRMIQSSWKGQLYAPGTNLRTLPPSTHGFLILTPTYEQKMNR